MVNSKNILNTKITLKAPPNAKKITAKIAERFFFPLAFLLLASSVAAIYLVFGKTYQSFRSGQDSLKVKEAELAKGDAERRLAVMQRHAAELESIPAAELERMAIVLPQGSNELETLIQLESFVRSLNLSLGDLQFSAGGIAAPKSGAAGSQGDADTDLIKSKVALDKADISFKASDYSSLKQIVSAIEKNLRLLDIDSLTYSAENGEVSANMTTYHLP